MSEIIAFDEKMNIIDTNYTDIVTNIFKTIKAMCENDLLITEGKYKFKLDEVSELEDDQASQILQRYSRNQPTINAILRSNFVENLNKLIIKFQKNIEFVP